MVLGDRDVVIFKVLGPPSRELELPLAAYLRTARGVNHECQRNWSKIPLSSKGQVVIPEEIRNRLGLKAGAQ